MSTVHPPKAYRGLPMEGIIATWYAKTTARDLKRHSSMAQQLAKKIPTHGRVLEIAPGPGYFCMELAKLGAYQITGLDISKSFVDIARRNAEKAGLDIDFQEGNASAMPLADETIDFTFCQAAFKNFSEPVEAISEMHRVLKPKGISVIVDLRRDATQANIDQEIDAMALNPINRFLVNWTFKHILLKSAYSLEDMHRLIAQTPFGSGRIEVDGVGFQIWLEK